MRRLSLAFAARRRFLATCSVRGFIGLEDDEDEEDDVACGLRCVSDDVELSVDAGVLLRARFDRGLGGDGKVLGRLLLL
jgi:hypothetical protein